MRRAYRKPSDPMCRPGTGRRRYAVDTVSSSAKRLVSVIAIVIVALQQFWKAGSSPERVRS
jgi:hypothetical protein